MLVGIGGMLVGLMLVGLHGMIALRVDRPFPVLGPTGKPNPWGALFGRRSNAVRCRVSSPK
jgi:hypothetical protein